MSWRNGVNLTFGRYRLQIFYGYGGCDRWLLVRDGGIVWAWSAPRWLSVMKDDGRLRGG